MMRARDSFSFKKLINSITIGLFGGLLILSLGPDVFADSGRSGFDTLCTASASSSLGKRGADGSVSVEAKLKTGKKPLVIEFKTQLDNALDFDGGSAEWSIVTSPSDNLNFSHFVVTTDANADCSLVGDIKAVYTDSNNGGQEVAKGLEDEGVFSSTLLEDSFNGLMDVLGFPNITLPTGTDKEIAESVCAEIQTQLSNGNSLALSSAGDLGSLMGAMASNVGRCLGASNIVKIVGSDGNANGCTGDDVATTLALQLLRSAPELDVQLTSDGAGTYSVTDLNPSGSGDSVQITVNSDGTCSASGALPQL